MLVSLRSVVLLPLRAAGAQLASQEDARELTATGWALAMPSSPTPRVRRQWRPLVLDLPPHRHTRSGRPAAVANPLAHRCRELGSPLHNAAGFRTQRRRSDVCTPRRPDLRDCATPGRPSHLLRLPHVAIVGDVDGSERSRALQRVATGLLAARGRRRARHHRRGRTDRPNRRPSRFTTISSRYEPLVSMSSVDRRSARFRWCGGRRQGKLVTLMWSCACARRRLQPAFSELTPAVFHQTAVTRRPR